MARCLPGDEWRAQRSSQFSTFKPETWRKSRRFRESSVASISERNAGDFHVECAHLEPRPSQALEILQGFVIEWEDLPLREHLRAVLHPSIDGDFICRFRFEPSSASQPRMTSSTVMMLMKSSPAYSLRLP